MKQIITLISALVLHFTVIAQSEGYHITIQIKPMKKTWVYMGYYYGKAIPICDSAFLDDQGRGVFKGVKTLPQGIYLLAVSKSRLLMEMLMGKKQYFSIITDTANPQALTKFSGSPENSQFQAYTTFIAEKGNAVEKERKQMAQISDTTMQAKLQAVINKNASEMNDYRKKIMREQPESLLAAIFSTMQDIVIPDKFKKVTTRQDSLDLYYYTRQHYWDGVDFMDGRIVRTPIFEKKINYYFNTYIHPEADSIIHEFNWMISLGRNDTEMFQFLINYFVDNYFKPKIMGQDKVFLYVYEKFFATKKVTWLTEKQTKQIEDRAMMLMANQLGERAAEMSLVDTSGIFHSLYAQPGNYTIVIFWDPNCGHCKTEIPKLDSLYNTSVWKKENVSIYAVMVAETSVADWKPFIKQHAIGWTHVHQTSEMKAEEIKNNQPNYHQLYDVKTTPTLFLLDKEKHIIAKNLSLEDLNKVLQQKIKTVGP